MTGFVHRTRYVLSEKERLSTESTFNYYFEKSRAPETLGVGVSSPLTSYEAVLNILS